VPPVICITVGTPGGHRMPMLRQSPQKKKPRQAAPAGALSAPFARPTCRRRARRG
jgi:hypothetical protein